MTIRTSIKRISGKNEISKSLVLKTAKALRQNSVRQFGPITTIKSDQSNIRLIEKMDGSYCRFGINNYGLFFLQSSNSVPATEDNFTIVFKNLPDFLETFSCLKQLQDLQEWFLKLFKTLGSFAISAEIFPLLTHEGDDDSVVFCGTKYSKHSLGEKGAFVTFDVATFDDTSDSYVKIDEEKSRQIQQELHDVSVNTFGHVWRIMPNHMYCYLDKEISFNLVELNDIVDDDFLYQNSLQLLRSPKMTRDKAQLVSKIEYGRKSMQQSLDRFADDLKSFLSDNCEPAEGVILSLKIDGTRLSLKGTSDSFDTTKKQLWHHRQLYLNIDRKIDTQLLREHFGFLKVTPVALNKMIRAVAEDFKFDENIEQKFYQYFLSKLNPPQNLFFKDLFELVEEFREIREDFEVEKDEFDCDTIRKTYDIQNRVLTRILNLENLGSHSSLTVQHQAELLRSCLGRRIKRLVNFETGDGIPHDDLDRAVVWVGRAQPWHKGHHNMVMQCLKRVSTMERTKVVILLVHGDESSENKIKNPLSFNTQLNVLNTLYGDDDRIIVSNKYLKSAYVANVLSVLHKLNMRLVGWVCGSDRIPSYRESLRQFNVQQFLLTHSYCPMSKDKSGDPCVNFLQAERVFSGTESRRLSAELDFDEWFRATIDLRGQASVPYKEVYECIRNTRPQSLQDTTNLYMLPSVG